MKIKTQLLAACIAVGAVSAQAQVAGTGLYVGGNVGQSKWKGGDFPGLDSSNIGGKLYGGYEFTPNLALELGYTEFGDFDYTGSSIKANGVFVDAVGKIPFTQKFSGLARVGAFSGKLKTGAGSDRGTSWKAGLGVQYDLTPNAAVRGEYERYRFDALGGTPKADMFTVGLNYRF
jgi:OOP family OmpA-OmpF porin